MPDFRYIERDLPRADKVRRYQARNSALEHPSERLFAYAAQHLEEPRSCMQFPGFINDGVLSPIALWTRYKSGALTSLKTNATGGFGAPVSAGPRPRNVCAARSRHGDYRAPEPFLVLCLWAEKQPIELELAPEAFAKVS